MWSPYSILVISLQNLRKSFSLHEGEVSVLQFDSLEIAEGETLAVVGASGSGKTTLLNMVGGLLLPSSGTIRVAGVEVTQLKEPERDRFRAKYLGMLFQSFHLLEAYSALENVELGAFFSGHAKSSEEAKDLLASLGLSCHLNHHPSQLSGGQQARVALARALVGRPKVLLADEPTGSLDAQAREDVLGLILSKAKKRKMTVLCATHDERVAQAFDQRILLS